MNPMLSIILCTRNRSEFLLHALRYFEEISSNIPWELLIVNNGSTDRTSLILNEFISNTSINVHVISEPKIGLSHARNTGWRSAKGEIIAFTDDDCYPKSDFVEKILENFSKSEIGFLGGRVLLFDPLDAPVTIQVCDTRLEFEPYTFFAAGLIHGANMSVRREVLEVCRGFDEMLGAGTRFPSEDVDFLSRASAAGFRGAYDPGPVVLHHHRRRSQQQVAIINRAYDLGRGAYYMKAIMDSSRRKKAIKHWYWSIRSNILRSIRAASTTWLHSAFEIEGALIYLFIRTTNSLRSIVNANRTPTS